MGNILWPRFSVTQINLKTWNTNICLNTLRMIFHIIEKKSQENRIEIFKRENKMLKIKMVKKAYNKMNRIRLSKKLIQKIKKMLNWNDQFICFLTSYKHRIVYFSENCQFF